MSDTPVPTPDGTPSFSQRLWSEEVGIAQADQPLPPKDPGYEFSNGRRFDSGQGAAGS